MSYLSEYTESIEHPETFWAEKADDLPWYRPPQTILSRDENGIDRWFADGEMNTAYMALDYHIEQGRGDQAAVIYDSPVTETRLTLSYSELRDQVARFAGVLRQQGVERGDRVIIYMPMVPEALVAMLAVARLGAVHSVVFGGFSSRELAVRIEDAEPKVVVSASCGVEVKRIVEYKPMLDEALRLSTHKSLRSVVLQRPEAPAQLIDGQDIDWKDAMAAAEPADCVPVKGTDPLYVLYTSGTTGKPKGVQRDNGGHAVALKYSMKAIYDMSPGDVFWAASDVGWVVGHSYIVYAPLLAGCTTVVYEGKPVRTPDAGAFWRVCADYRVKVLFAAPTAFRAIIKEDAQALEFGKYDTSALQTIFMAGERLDPPTYEWTVEKTGKTVVDHWWQTETGWAICGNLMGIEAKPTKPGSSTLPMPGYDIRILDAEGHQLPPGEQGSIAIKLPLPPSCLATLWRDFARFRDGYLSDVPGYYTTGDGGYMDEEGYVFIMGRTDDVINVAGHRLSTGEMEEIVAAHPAVAECVVIGLKDPIKGQAPTGLVILKDGIEVDEKLLEQELIAMVRKQIGPIACFNHALVVQRLPKTRSGKILRKLIRQIADGEEYAVPSTIDDVESLSDIESTMRLHGLQGPAAVGHEEKRP
ncbi:propionyl-CoA synthetase [Chromatocurvus halotolerans]|uniref:Propionyl-CoA synthetase n=1 Tax=Chromatocurvus halotolerans TaxID=1132028 RepID=A0A4R2KNR8_9GAMM|nr:propionyl-CoA synthetase [Chromatocurvus halotolerans]TCO75144.1 propionyl-CoA synthetase [Chromatocurvus halotolerans]